MADPGDSGDMADLQARLDALRASGAAECDPVRFAYLDALARRAAPQAEAIRRPLLDKLHLLADQLTACPAPAPSESPPTATISPLAELLAYIGQQAEAPPNATQIASNAAFPQGGNSRPQSKNTSAGRAAQAPELKSVAYFRNEWSKLSTEQQLTQTLAQAPENAGPMNSQHLVLRSLQVMRDIAPDYLQGFMSYVDTLIWLEHADPTKPPAGRSSAGEGANKTRTAKRSVTKR